MDKLKQYNYRSARKSIIAAIVMYFIIIAIFAAILITTSFLDIGPSIDPDTGIAKNKSIIILYLPVYVSLFVAIGISGLLLLIFYILSIIQVFKAQVHDILLIVGLFMPLFGLIALFIKLVYVNKKIAELKFDEMKPLEIVK